MVPSHRIIKPSTGRAARSCATSLLRYPCPWKHLSSTGEVFFRVSERHRPGDSNEKGRASRGNKGNEDEGVIIVEVVNV